MFKILFCILSFLSLCFGAFEEEFGYFDENFFTSKYDVQIKLHHKLKNLYIQSVIYEDEKNKIEVLKRLIISSNTLNLDDKNYADELKESGMDVENINTLRQISTRKARVENAVFTPNVSEEPLLTASKTPSKENPKKIYVLSSKKVPWGLELNLNSKLGQDHIKSFTLNEKNNFRFIADFEAALEGGKKDYQFEGFSITLSQYNPKTTRIVVRSEKKLFVSFDLQEKTMSISVNFKEDSNQASNTKTTRNQDLKTQSTSNTTNEANLRSKQKKPDSEKYKSAPSIEVLTVEKISNGVILGFNQALNESEVTSLGNGNSKSTGETLRFKAKLRGGNKKITFGQNTIIISQYNPNSVQIISNFSKEFKLLKEFNDKNLILSFESQKSQMEEGISSVDPGKNKNTLSQNFKSSKIIVIDPGHGGKDSGAVGDKNENLREKDVVLNLALRLGSELEKRGYKVFYTRNTDKFINLRDRTKFANDKKADLFLSIHANAAPSAEKTKSSEGVETFFLSPARSERSKRAAEKENHVDFDEINYFSKQSILNFLNREKIVASNKLAIDIQKNILSTTRKKYKIVDGGVREAPFWVLVGAQMPAILLEIGYITHPSEGKRIANKNFQELLVKGIADGVENYFYNNP